MQNFPLDLTKIFQRQSDPILEKQEIANLFNTNDSVRQAFLTWAHLHGSVTAHNPRLYQAYNLAFNAELEEHGDPLEKIAQRISLLSHWILIASDRHHELEDILQKDSKNLSPEDKDVISRNLEKIIILCDTGIIIPWFKAISPHFAMILLLMKNEKGQTLLHDHFPAIIPVIQALPHELLIQLFSERNNDGRPPLHYSKNLIAAIPLLQTLPSELLISLFSISSIMGTTPLHEPELLTASMPLLQTFSPELLIQLLSKTDSLSYGMTPLHNPKVLTASMPLLQNLPDELIIRLLSIPNRLFGMTPLHDHEVLTASIPLLQPIPPELLIPLLSPPNKIGLTPLHYHEVLKASIPLLQLIPPELIIRLLSLQNRIGMTPLHDLEGITASMPLLQILNPEKLVQLLSIPNINGMTPLQDPKVLIASIPLLQTLPPDLLTQLLSLCDNKGRNFLHVSDNLKAFIPLLQTLPPDLLTQLLSLRDDNGRTTLHFLENFKSAVPLLQKLPDEFLIALLITENNVGKTPLQKKEIFDLAISSINKLHEIFYDINKMIPFLNLPYVRDLVFFYLSPEKFQTLPDDIRLFFEICRECSPENFNVINLEFDTLQSYFNLMEKNNPIRIAEMNRCLRLMAEGSFAEAYSFVDIIFDDNIIKLKDKTLTNRPEIVAFALKKYKDFPKFVYITDSWKEQEGVDVGGLRNQAVSDLALNLLDNKPSRLAKMEPDGLFGTIPVWRVAAPKKKSLSQVAFSTESGLTVNDQPRLYEALGSLLAKCFLVPSVVTGRVLTDQYISLLQKLYQAQNEEIQSYFEVYGTLRDKAMIELLYSTEEFNNDKMLKYYFLKSCTPVDTQIPPGVIEFTQMIEASSALLINAYANPETDIRTAISQLCRQNLNELIPSNEIHEVVSPEAFSDILFHGSPDFASVIGYTLSLAALNQLDNEKPFDQQLNILITWIEGHIPQVTKEDLKKEFVAEFRKFGGENKLHPARAIVEGIRSVLGGKKEEQAFLTLPSAFVSEQIQGQSFNREEIAQRIVTDPEASENVITQANWLKECVLDETRYDEAWIKKILVAATGQPAVTASTKVEVEGSSKPLITSATCFKKIYVPESPLTKDRFLELLNYLVETKEFGLA